MTGSCERCGEPFESSGKRRFCSRRCQQRAWDATQYRRKCECGKTIRRNNAKCRDCFLREYRAGAHRRRIAIAALWNEGLSLREIAERLGSTINATGGEMARMRANGWDLPYRRSGWKGHSRPTGRKEQPVRDHEHARSKVANALRYGRITKPTDCERCGETGNLDAHHHDYAKPLDVEWLCVRCHAIEHGAVYKEAA